MSTSDGAHSTVRSPSDAIVAFVSYSHHDAHEEAELRKHLASLTRQGYLGLWDDARILAGEDWNPRISENLERSHVVFVLLSPDYLASDACRLELQRALELRVTRGIRVLPIVLRACDWQSTRVAGIQPAWGRAAEAPLAGLPSGDDRDRALQTIVERIKPVLRDLGATALGDYGAFDLDLGVVDFDVHRRYLQAQHGRWAGEYAPLDAEALVAQLGSKFKPTGAPPVPVTDVARRYPHLVLMGGPGAGKTTTLLFLAQALARDTSGAFSRPPACIYIQLSRFRRTESMTPLEGIYDLVAEALHNSQATHERLLPGAAGRILERIPAVLLLDALNELATERRSECLRGISDLAKRHGSARLILTSRPHGFNAQDLLEGWEFFAITDLNDGQIRDLVERRLGQTPLASDLLVGLANRQSLLRIPLFLRMLLELAPRDVERTLRRLGNRSGLIKDYADYLLDWNRPGATAESEVRGTLMHAARLLHAEGQHIREDELRRRIDEQALEEAFRRGVLVRDEGYVRFLHQVFQEHFHAAAVVDDWRHRRSKVPHLPREVRKILTRPALIEVASHIVALVDDTEARVLLDYVSTRSHTLTLRWLDDICAEPAPRIDLAPALHAFRRSLARGLFYSRLPFMGRDTTSLWERLVKLAVLAYVVGGLGVSFVLFLHDSGVLPLGDVTITVIAGAVGALLAFPVWWTFVPAGRAEALLMATRDVRSASLRQQLMGLVARAAGSRVANPSLRSLATNLLTLSESPSTVGILSTSGSPYGAIRLLAYDPSRLAFHLLAELLAQDNCFGIAALRALDIRAQRFPAERTEIMARIRGMSEHRTPDLRIYLEAQSMLMRDQEHHMRPRDWWLRVLVSPRVQSPWGWAVRRYQQNSFQWATTRRPLGIAAVAAVSALLLVSALQWAIGLSLAESFAIAFFMAYLIAYFTTPPLVYRDAKRIGIGSLKGGDGLNELGPRGWTVVSLCFPVFVIPLYLWQRSWALRSANPDWKACEARAGAATAQEAASRSE